MKIPIRAALRDQADEYVRELAEAQEHKKASETSFEKVMKAEEERLMKVEKERREKEQEEWNNKLYRYGIGATGAVLGAGGWMLFEGIGTQIQMASSLLKDGGLFTPVKLFRGTKIQNCR